MHAARSALEVSSLGFLARSTLPLRAGVFSQGLGWPSRVSCRIELVARRDTILAAAHQSIRKGKSVASITIAGLPLDPCSAIARRYR